MNDDSWTAIRGITSYNQNHVLYLSPSFHASPLLYPNSEKAEVRA